MAITRHGDRFKGSYCLRVHTFFETHLFLFFHFRMIYSFGHNSTRWPFQEERLPHNSYIFRDPVFYFITFIWFTVLAITRHGDRFKKSYCLRIHTCFRYASCFILSLFIWFTVLIITRHGDRFKGSYCLRFHTLFETRILFIFSLSIWFTVLAITRHGDRFKRSYCLRIHTFFETHLSYFIIICMIYSFGHNSTRWSCQEELLPQRSYILRDASFVFLIAFIWFTTVSRGATASEFIHSSRRMFFLRIHTFFETHLLLYDFLCDLQFWPSFETVTVSRGSTAS